MAEPLNSHAAPPPERLAENLERPALDNRTYRVIKLKNELEALLVHDPDTDKVSAALDVNVGSFSDADDMPGMAHAVEHLLFMGTKKFPVENAYNEYLSAHSGKSNAFTAQTSTNYFFEVAAETHPSSGQSDSEAVQASAFSKESPLYGALDRFAQFFIAPLFLADTVRRELEAVDSENKKNLQSDSWRLHQLNKSLSNPEHPFCHFSTGNLKTLHDEPLARGVQIRDEFIRFYEKHYSANRMKLVVLGRESLDVLETWVEELFTPIVNKQLPQNRWDHVEPYTEKELGMRIFAKPVFQTRTLQLYFPYQDEEELYESQPSRYLSHLIGHEGPGSILAYIKEKGWADGLGAGAVPLCPGSAFFSISVNLTQEGLDHYKEVTKVLFQYIAVLRKTPPQAWIVDEMKRMSEVDFRFKQKSPAMSTTSSLSGIMQKPYPREWLLSGPSLIRTFQPETIIRSLEYLRPDNFRMIVVSQDFPGGWDQKEKWYGTEYKYEPMEVDFLEELKNATNGPSNSPAQLHLPHKNEFIPTRLEVEKKEIEEPVRVPRLIRNDENARIWYKKDDRFWVPKANLMVTLRTPLVSLTPRNALLARLFKELVNDALVEYSYAADIAGLEYAIGLDAAGLDIIVSGYNDKMPVLLEKVLTSLRDLKVKDDRFRIIHERLLRQFRNSDFQQPFHQVGTYSSWLSSERGWINDQYLSELPYITADDVRAFQPQLLSQLHTEVLAHGNLYREDVLNMADLVEKTLKTRTLPLAQWPIRRSLVLPEASDFVYTRPLKDPANVNNCMEYLIYVGSAADRVQRAKILLFAQLTEEPVYHTLRTTEQLGYAIFSSARIRGMWAGYRILIQSERSPEYLQSRVDEFLKAFEWTLWAMTEAQLEKHKRSLINQRKEKPKNLSQESSRYWQYITSERYDFEQIDHDVAHIAALTKADLVDFFRTSISPYAPKRSRITVNMRAQTSPSASSSPPLPTDPTSSLITPLTSFLKNSKLVADVNAETIAVEAEKFMAHVSIAELHSTGAAALVDAGTKYFTEDKQLPAQQAEALIPDLISAVKEGLATLGIRPEGAPSIPNGDSPGASNGDGTEKHTAQHEIKDVRVWKAGLLVSEGLQPVKDLSEFEELEPKL